MVPLGLKFYKRKISYNMNCKKNYIHPKSLQQMVMQKRKQVAELQEQYAQYKIKSSGTTIENLNSQYLALQAENGVLKTSSPNVIPRCKTLLFAWTHQKLQEDIRNLEELLSYQKNMKEISLEKESEFKSLQLSTPILEFEEEKEIESFRSDILLCMHQKLIRRLRRITREYFPAVADSEQENDGNLLKDRKKSLFFILQALFPDLKGNSLSPNEWEKVRGTHVKDSYPKEYVELLVSSKIIEFDEKSNFMKIIV